MPKDRKKGAADASSKGKSSTVPRKAQVAFDEEFPLLSRLGLYASETTGDGNCLFRALSDQKFGNEVQHPQLRRDVVAYIRENKERFAAFVGEFDETFDQYVRRMAQDATYGGHLEIVAFAEQFGHEVAIYQADSMYIVQPTTRSTDSRVHVAYHTWEHYSSIRNKAGPHVGPPEISPVASEDTKVALDTRNDARVPQWKVDIVLKSAPSADESVVRKMLETRDYSAVVEELIMQEAEDEANAAISEQGSAAAVASPQEGTGASSKPHYSDDSDMTAAAATAPHGTAGIDCSVQRDLAPQARENAPKIEEKAPVPELTRKQAARLAKEEKRKRLVERKMAKGRPRKAKLAQASAPVQADAPAKPAAGGQQGDLPVDPIYI